MSVWVTDWRTGFSITSISTVFLLMVNWLLSSHVSFITFHATTVGEASSSLCYDVYPPRMLQYFYSRHVRVCTDLGRARPPNFSFASDSFEVSGPLIISSLLSFLFFLSALGSAERASSALFRSSLFERQLLQMQRDQQGDPQFQLPDLTLGSHHFFTYLIL